MRAFPPKRLVGRTIALALGGLALLVFSRQIVTLFLLVTVGGPALDLLVIFGWTLQPLGLEIACPLGPLTLWAVLALPAAAWLTVRARRLAGWRYALFVAGSCSLPLLLAFSYRFPALVAALALAGLQQRPAPRFATPTRSWVILLLAMALSFAPADVSLRVRPHGRHFAPASSGMPTGDTGNYDEDIGDTVTVGGCVALYNEPQWVWVW
jgi:hypothetical protein